MHGRILPWIHEKAAEKVLKALELKLGIDLWGHSILSMVRVIEDETNMRILQRVHEKLLGKSIFRHVVFQLKLQNLSKRKKS
ncbi:MAG: HEPN domain-containing protein [Thermotogae bacterium]|nr:HEPN domain-containing protein [Thermotogota bacterium]